MIEQQQIITTHNLATCVKTLNIDLDGRKLALKVWDWILTTMSRERLDFNDYKNIGYAWRQLLFFVSIAENTDGLTSIMRERLVEYKMNFLRTRNMEAIFVANLELALRGEKPKLVLLGCPLDRHPLALAHDLERSSSLNGLVNSLFINGMY